MQCLFLVLFLTGAWMFTHDNMWSTIAFFGCGWASAKSDFYKNNQIT